MPRIKNARNRTQYYLHDKKSVLTGSLHSVYSDANKTNDYKRDTDHNKNRYCYQVRKDDKYLRIEIRYKNYTW